MPPVYEWLDEISGKSFSVYKDTFEKYREEPTDEELLEEERGKERKWVKQLGSGIRVIRGESWGPGKGSWGK